MDSLTLTFYGIGAILSLIALLISIASSIRFYRKGLKGMLRLALPAGLLAFVVLVRCISFLAANWGR